MRAAALGARLGRLRTELHSTLFQRGFTLPLWCRLTQTLLTFLANAWLLLKPGVCREQRH